MDLGQGDTGTLQQLICPALISLSGNKVQSAQVLIQAQQDMFCILGRRTVYLLQLAAAVITPLTDAVGSHFQVALKGPMRAQAETFIQAMRAV
jgi:hypothetical protein